MEGLTIPCRNPRNMGEIIIATRLAGFGYGLVAQVADLGPATRQLSVLRMEGSPRPTIERDFRAADAAAGNAGVAQW